MPLLRWRIPDGRTAEMWQVGPMLRGILEDCCVVERLTDALHDHAAPRN